MEIEIIMPNQSIFNSTIFTIYRETKHFVWAEGKSGKLRADKRNNNILWIREKYTFKGGKANVINFLND
jgi:hypothetical protein